MRRQFLWSEILHFRLRAYGIPQLQQLRARRLPVKVGKYQLPPSPSKPAGQKQRSDAQAQENPARGACCGSIFFRNSVHTDVATPLGFSP